MPKPEISIVVPCYQAASFLTATVESVLRQDFANWELLLVDDGSTDATWDLIERYVGLDSRIIGFRKENEGTTKTRNVGFSKSSPRSTYLWFLDHDDQLEPNALSLLRAHLESHPDVGLVACQFQDIDAEGRRLGSGGVRRWAPGRVLPRALRDDEFDTPFVTFFCATGQGPFAMYRRSVYLQTDGWDTKFWPHEDTDMFCQMALKSKVHFLPDRAYLKRTHAAQGMNDATRVQRAYAAFRDKWDHRNAATAEERAMLEHALRHYRSRHRPCRDLKVASKAFSEFVARPRLSSLRWMAQLVGSALNGFIRSERGDARTSQGR